MNANKNYINQSLVQLYIISIFLLSLASAESQIFQKTWTCCESATSDSVTLSDSADYNPSWFSTINIFRNGKRIFGFHDSIGGFKIDGNIFKEHRFNNGADSYLIFTCNGAPNEDHFFVIHKSKTGYDTLGYTPSSSAEIFGDIDYDGVFEIGGFQNLHEAGDTYQEVLASLKREYKIFEVKPGFPIDSTLTKKMLPLVVSTYLKTNGFKKK